MEWIDWLKEIGLPVEDAKHAQTFINQYEDTIKTFVHEKWNEYLPNQENELPLINDSEQIENRIELDEMKFGESTNQGKENAEKRETDFLQLQVKNKHVTVSNGKVKQKYCFLFDAEADFPGIENVIFEGLETIGLQYNTETKTIEGTPTQAGDHKIIMRYGFKNREESRPTSLEKEFTLIVNPDPRSLWKNTPTPLDEEYYKPDEDKAFVKVESKTTRKLLGLKQEKEARKDMVAASQRGRSHAHESKARDDDFKLYFDDASEWYVMVVADGAGSAKYSREGSRIACTTVVEVCKAKIFELKDIFETQITEFHKTDSNENRKKIGDSLYSIIGTAAFKAVKNIEQEAQKKPILMKEFSTTLLVSICKKFEFGWFVGAFWVGDGGMGIYRKEEPEYLKILGEPDGGEFAGQTRFLTMPEIIQPTEIYRRLRFDIVSDFTALILMTDGVTDPKFETDANLNRIEKWHALWDDLNGNNEDNVKVDFSDDNEQSADQLLEWLNFWSKGNHDDRTIAILF
ncbi:MAG: protein phosphatase 2C domain-containing protein [Dysgonamonadaceae bacterium]|jgi:serine/threonine protein phosphatase PrpC|nr:protein phosphatase 2C domain-containing protein [Dysgonamonadaceae bacterium]